MQRSPKAVAGAANGQDAIMRPQSSTQVLGLDEDILNP
jgi:hypothetical protein